MGWCGRSVALLLALSAVPAAQAGGGGGLRVPYTCTDGTRIQATYVGPRASVRVNGRVLEMNTARSGSGARYVGGGFTWWTKGPSADLYRGTDPGALTHLNACRAP